MGIKTILLKFRGSSPIEVFRFWSAWNWILNPFLYDKNSSKLRIESKMCFSAVQRHEKLKVTTKQSSYFIKARTSQCEYFFYLIFMIRLNSVVWSTVMVGCVICLWIEYVGLILGILALLAFSTIREVNLDKKQYFCNSFSSTLEKNLLL